MNLRWVIVAHPDDEIIFAGGTILSHADEPWTAVIVTTEAGSGRLAEALRARDELRGLGVDIDYRFLDHEDGRFQEFGGIDQSLLVQQLAGLGVQAGERVYTHGPPGEYGHDGHKAVSWAVRRALGEAAVVSTFSGGGAILEKIDDSALLARKIRIFNQAYVSQSGVWIGLARTMLEAARAETHFAPPSARGVAPDDLDPDTAPADLGATPSNALAEAVRERIGLVAVKDALLIGLDPAVDLQTLQTHVAGRIDVIDNASAARGAVDALPGAQVIAADFLAWQPGERTYDLVLWVGSLQHVPDFRAAIGKACKILRPQGQMILSHEPLIEGHPRQGQAYSMDEGLYRRPTQAVLEISKRNGMKLRVVKDLVVSHRPGPPVICQLAHLQLR